MRRFAQVDVFTARAGLGNPVAVVLDAEGLSDAEMARLANWTNLSETTFVLPPTSAEADYRVRIFTPSVELPFAGHPTIGTCWALLDAGLLPADRNEWVQESAAGLVQVRRDEGGGGGLTFAVPEAAVTASPVEAALLEQVLGGVAPADPLMIDLGPRWLTARVSLEALNSLRLDVPAFMSTLELSLTGINLYAVDDEKQLHLRSFFDGGGVLTEDPVCGSGNAAAAVHLQRTGAHGGRQPDRGGAPGQCRRRHRGRQGRHRGGLCR